MLRNRLPRMPRREKVQSHTVALRGGGGDGGDGGGGGGGNAMLVMAVVVMRGGML